MVLESHEDSWRASSLERMSVLLRCGKLPADTSDTPLSRSHNRLRSFAESLPVTGTKQRVGGRRRFYIRFWIPSALSNQKEAVIDYTSGEPPVPSPSAIQLHHRRAGHAFSYEMCWCSTDSQTAARARQQTFANVACLIEFAAYLAPSLYGKKGIDLSSQYIVQEV